MSKINKIIYFFISTIFFVLFNLFLTKEILDNRLMLQNNKIIDIMFVQNTGAAFSLLENNQLFLIVFAILAILLIIFYGLKNAEKFSAFASFWSALLTAGIFCNLYERIIYGYVRDYFKLNFIDFPIFNISDIMINISVFALIIIIIKNKYLKNNEINN